MERNFDFVDQFLICDTPTSANSMDPEMKDSTQNIPKDYE